MTMDELELVKKAVIRKYPISAGIALDNRRIELDESIDTAAVVSKRQEDESLKIEKIVINPKFMENLTFSERVFVLSHETFHIALKHIKRSQKKPDRDAIRKYNEYCETETDPKKREIYKALAYKKYHKIWNVAADACINAFLKSDGLSFPVDPINPHTGQRMQLVDMEVGNFKSAEKIYDYLVKREEEKQKQNNNSGNTNSNSENNSMPQGEVSLDDIDIDNYQGFDSHDSWDDEDFDDKLEKSNNSNNGNEDSKGSSKSGGSDDSSEGNKSDDDIDEEELFEKELNSRNAKSEGNLKDSLAKVRKGIGLDNSIAIKPVISWKRLLVGILEKTEEVWGNRRSSRFNPNARIEERVFEKLPSVEVVLDASGSISGDLLRGFLLQLYPLFESLYNEENVSMKVGTFDDEFHGFETINSRDDIVNLKPHGGGGTNFEAAACAFTNDPGRTITKIVFTDGQAGVHQETRVDDIIWVVFGDRMNFEPVGGRIIKVSDEEYNDIIKSGSSKDTNGYQKRR